MIRRSSWMFSYVWEKGRHKTINEDTLLVRSIHTAKGELIMACVCDGMGGLEYGQNASGYAAEELEKWFVKELMPSLEKGAKGATIRNKGIRIFEKINQVLFLYMRQKKVLLGTTASLLILFGKRYYCFHIGDSRVYKLKSSSSGRAYKNIRQITKDHKKEQHILNRCIGLNHDGKPDFYTGVISDNGRIGFLICSDGFTHIFSQKDIKKAFNPGEIKSEATIKKRLLEITNRSIERGEKDNITAVYIRL